MKRIIAKTFIFLRSYRFERFLRQSLYFLIICALIRFILYGVL